VKIYLAHNYAAKEWLRNVVAKIFTSAGHEVTSRWVTEGGFDSAVGDLEDLERADTLVYFSWQAGTIPGAGKFVELGYAIRAGKRVFVVDDKWQLTPKCIFHGLPTLVHVEKVEDVLRFL
jgi:hypothetical protein